MADDDNVIDPPILSDELKEALQAELDEAFTQYVDEVNEQGERHAYDDLRSYEVLKDFAVWLTHTVDEILADAADSEHTERVHMAQRYQL